MIGRTLGIYISRRFLNAVFGVLGVLFALIFVLDFVETMRRASDVPGASVSMVAAISLFRTPSIVEQTLPFVLLFGGIICFVGLSRRLELVVARAAGLSVWQFLTPPVILALLLGVAAAIGFNPLSAQLKSRSDAIETKVFGARKGQESSNLWIRQHSFDGQAVIHAVSRGEGGIVINGVTFYIFDQENRFQRRVEADSAALSPGKWHLTNVRELVPDHQIVTYETLDLATDLTVEQANQTFAASADTVSFWRLSAAIALANAAGLDANEYRLQYQTLLARPVLLLAMVLIAATVSLRFARFGGIGWMILGGIGAGFVLYVVTKIAKDLGNAGLVDPSAAAWSPAVVGMLIGFTVLLNQEDG